MLDYMCNSLRQCHIVYYTKIAPDMLKKKAQPIGHASLCNMRMKLS